MKCIVLFGNTGRVYAARFHEPGFCFAVINPENTIFGAFYISLGGIVHQKMCKIHGEICFVNGGRIVMKSHVKIIEQLVVYAFPKVWLPHDLLRVIDGLIVDATMHFIDITGNSLGDKFRPKPVTFLLGSVIR